MCYAKPGPRCSNHAKKTLQAAISKQNKLKKQLDRTSLEGEKRSEIYAKYHESLKEVAAAEKIYYTTPEGIKHLEDKAEAYYQERGHKSLYQQQQIEMCKLIRERQFALYHANKHRTDNPHEYAADENNATEIYQQLKKGYGENNIYIGKETVKPTKTDPRTARRYAIHQQRLDNLVNAYRDKNGSIKIYDDMVDAYNEHDLLPGYKLLGKGTYQAAYLDEVSGDVIKIPLGYEDDEVEAGMRGEDEVANEQYNYAVLNVEALNSHDAEYVETLFYTHSENKNLNVIVQPYLNPEEYVDVEEIDDVQQRTLFKRKANNAGNEIEGLDDVHDGNYYVNKKTGKIVLFDCLTDIEGDRSDW